MESISMFATGMLIFLNFYAPSLRYCDAVAKKSSPTFFSLLHKSSSGLVISPRIAFARCT